MKALNYSLLLLFACSILVISSCKKEEDETLKYPKISTKSIHSITNSSAIAGGTVIEEGESPIIKKGLCWGISPSPTISGFHSDNGGGKNEFDAQMGSLQAGTKYYVRAYATNEHGTGYGEEKSFTTL